MSFDLEYKPGLTPSVDRGSQNCEEVLKPQPHSRSQPGFWTFLRILNSFQAQSYFDEISKSTFTNPSAPALALVVPRQIKAESTLQLC